MSRSRPPAGRGGPTGSAAGPTESIELPFDGSRLPPGWYTHGDFEPRVALRLGDGWHAVQVAPGFFDVEREPGTPQVVAVQLARPVYVHRAPAERVAVASAAEAVAALRANESLRGFGAGPGKLDGIPGWQITVEPSAGRDTPVLAVAAGTIGLLPARRLRVILLDRPGGLLAVLVGGPTDGWASAVRSARPVLDSLRIGD